MNTIVPLVQIPSGSKARIRTFRGGFGFVRRLEALGIREGKEIVKVSGPQSRGPVVLRCGGTQVAIGFGMAQKIFVEIV